jgi:hypothetical protein
LALTGIVFTLFVRKATKQSGQVRVVEHPKNSV